MHRPNHRSRRLAFMLGSFLLLPVLFQGLLRYEYFSVGPTIWRIDRLTQQACRMNVEPLDCTPPLPLFAWPQGAALRPAPQKWRGSTFEYALLRHAPPSTRASFDTRASRRYSGGATQDDKAPLRMTGRYSG
jgi:hypothetical protein